MNPVMQPWKADFRIAAALDSSPLFWIWGLGFFLIGLFLTFSAFGVFLLVHPAHPPPPGPGLVWVIGPLYCGTGHVF